MATHATTAPAWPKGFRATGGACGIKRSGAPDLALLVCDAPATAAAVFTRNLVAAAPVQVSRAHLAATGGMARALIVNSGCANAATGDEGLARCRRTVRAAAELLQCPVDQVLVNSTGVIGVQLEAGKIVDALPGLARSLAAGSCEPFARAIMTTDAAPKWASRDVRCSGADGAAFTARITGVAKGAGMIHPDMATMIATLTTDATLDAPTLHGMLRDAVERSFHRISVDGDTSTNDSVFALASGAAGVPSREDLKAIGTALTEVAHELALMVVCDGEGAGPGIAVHVEGARTASDALALARTVATSLLVRTAVTGRDPNWGRILAALGRAGVHVDPASIEVRAGGVALFSRGAPAAVTPEERARAFAGDTVTIDVRVGTGPGRDSFWSAGLTTRYVELNSAYTT
ncbi:MAG: bifunctional glutamate N-acetyltransferase/amino-acid acetyltransferase ArgJ [Phycisphaerales bacterium]|nr:bifunctional glutamate N-acetyltransferase/amino-acid acetyltransferase ArgJ [Phycisphaerales bacterium]